jgi:hypothetical protein
MRKMTKMTKIKALASFAGATLVVVSFVSAGLAVSGAAYAWSTDGNGSIRCGDGSSATVRQLDDGSWTATSAGNNGKTGGHFAIEGQAALYACGEG